MGKVQKAAADNKAEGAKEALTRLQNSKGKNVITPNKSTYTENNRKSRNGKPKSIDEIEY